MEYVAIITYDIDHPLINHNLRPYHDFSRSIAFNYRRIYRIILSR